MLVAAAITAWGYWPALERRIPWLRRFERQPMTMHDLIRRVAFESRWSKGYDMQAEREAALQLDWQAALKWYFCEPLKAGRIRATGLRYDKDGLAVGRDAIPPEFWGSADFSPLLALYELEADFAGAGSGDSYVQYTQIQFDRAGVSREWPVAKSGGSPFVEPANEARAEQDQALAAEQARWISENRHLFEQGWAKPPTAVGNAQFSEAWKREAGKNEQSE